MVSIEQIFAERLKAEREAQGREKEIATAIAALFIKPTVDIISILKPIYSFKAKD